MVLIGVLPGSPSRARRRPRTFSSLFANQAAGFERISRLSLSCRFSRRSRLSSWRSSVIRPSLPGKGLPAMVCAEQPNSRESSAGVRPTHASSTICWRNSARYGDRVRGSLTPSRFTVRCQRKWFNFNCISNPNLSDCDYASLAGPSDREEASSLPGATP